MKRVNVINESEMKVNLWMSTSEITSKNDRKKRKRRWIKEKDLVSNHSKWSFAYVKNDQRVTAMCWWCKVSHFCFWGVWIFQRTSKIVKRRRQYGGGHGNATQSGAYETNFKTIRLHSPTSSSYEEQNLSWGPTWHRKTPRIKKKKKKFHAELQKWAGIPQWMLRISRKWRTFIGKLIVWSYERLSYQLSMVKYWIEKVINRLLRLSIQLPWS